MLYRAVGRSDGEDGGTDGSPLSNGPNHGGGMPPGNGRIEHDDRRPMRTDQLDGFVHRGGVAEEVDRAHRFELATPGRSNVVIGGEDHDTMWEMPSGRTADAAIFRRMGRGCKYDDRRRHIVMLLHDRFDLLSGEVCIFRQVFPVSAVRLGLQGTRGGRRKM